MVDLSFKDIRNRLVSAGLPKADVVVGIGTGGIVPASLVAFHLGCELKIMTLNFRDEKNAPQHNEPMVLKIPNLKQQLDGILNTLSLKSSHRAGVKV